LMVVIKSGAEIREGVVVEAVVENKEGGLNVQTNRGIVRCDKVVYATNAWTGALVPSLRQHILPVTNHVVSVSLPTPSSAPPSLPSSTPAPYAAGLHPGYIYWQISGPKMIVGGFRNSSPGKVLI